MSASEYDLGHKRQEYRNLCQRQQAHERAGSRHVRRLREENAKLSAEIRRAEDEQREKLRTA